MKIQTTRFGELEIDSKDMITFPRGILGFEGLTRYCLIRPESNLPFGYLQSLDDPDLTFVVVDPQSFWPDYRVEVEPPEVADLEISNPEDVAVLAIVTIPQDARKMTANLQGPLLINTANRKAKQVVLSGDRYTTRHRLFPDIKQEQTA